MNIRGKLILIIYSSLEQFVFDVFNLGTLVHHYLLNCKDGAISNKHSSSELRIIETVDHLVFPHFLHLTVLS